MRMTILISALLLSACAAAEDQTLAPEIEAQAVTGGACGGTVTYFRWVCNHTTGRYVQTQVGEHSQLCYYPFDGGTTGTETSWFEPDLESCWNKPVICNHPSPVPPKPIALCGIIVTPT